MLTLKEGTERWSVASRFAPSAALTDLLLQAISCQDRGSRSLGSRRDTGRWKPTNVSSSCLLQSRGWGCPRPEWPTGYSSVLCPLEGWAG